MNIYAIRNDGFRFQELDLDINDIIDYFPDEVSYDDAHDFSLNNLSLKDFWPDIATGFAEIADQENLPPDITTWINATLVLSPRAFRYLGDMLTPFGEFLPVHVGDSTYQIFNCLTVAEVVESESDETKLVFDEKSISGKLVFKSTFQKCIDIFCGEQLKNVIEELELGGVVFDTRLATPFQ